MIAPSSALELGCWHGIRPDREPRSTSSRPSRLAPPALRALAILPSVIPSPRQGYNAPGVSLERMLDLDLLENWAARAATSTTADEVFAS